MSNALEKVFSHNSLLNAWEEVNRKSKGSKRDSTVGIDGISINQFAKHASEYLESIKANKYIYTFNNLRAYLIEKPATKGKTNKHRVICVPTVKDRIVQRALLDHLSEGDKCKLINEISYGFVRSPVDKKGVQAGIKQAKKLRTKHPWVFKTDIASFFDTIDRGYLEAAISKKVRSEYLRPVLKKALSCEIQESSRSRQRAINRNGIEEGYGVRQGMPLSPFYANLVLSDFDKLIIKNGIKAVRYADDLIFFAQSEQECLEIEEFCKKELKKIGLDISKSKTETYNPDEVVEFLGLGLVKKGSGYSIEVMPNQFDQIRSEILSYKSFSTLKEKNVTIKTIGTKLESTIAGYRKAYEYADNHSDLESVISSCQTKVYKELFNKLGIKLDSLTQEQREFLTI